MLKARHIIVVGACIAALISQPEALAGSKPQPCAPSIAVCPVTGCSGNPSDPHAPVDKELNRRKNRSLAQIPSDRIGPYDVNQFRDPAVLPTHAPTGNPKDLRSTWAGGDTAAADVRAAENHKSAVIGYILRAKPGDAESCNCDIATRDVVDTHINIIEDANGDSDPSQLLGESVIAEITHRYRDPAWTLHALNAMALATQNGQSKPRVRIIGALTYDNLHWDMLKNGTRGTLWEVHPIQEIDVEVNRQWVPFTGAEAPNARAAYREIVHLLNTPPNALLAQPAQGPPAVFTNARIIRWSPQQVHALDARMESDAS